MKYVALLRGIGPSNPNMHGKKLKWFFETLGFKNVQVVISSGNVVFESSARNEKTLETKIEKALPTKLHFKSTTIVRREQELQKIVNTKPFKNKQHSQTSYLLVTFFKKGGELFNVIDTSASRTPDFMVQLEKKYGKEITSRTWKTVQRILAKML